MDDINNAIKNMEPEIVSTMIELISKKAISPESGGSGELERAVYLQGLLEKIGVDKIERVDAKDNHNVIRPNILALVYGKQRDRTAWIVAHMDTVPEGDLSLWNTDPFQGVYKDGKIYGRGSVDNGQAILTALFTLKILKKLGISPKYNLGLMFVADEEVGSKYGIDFVLKNRNFSKNDLFYVPDSGNSEGTEIEIAEKSILWIKVKVNGKQAHGSRPDLGLNANRIAMLLNTEIDKELHKKFTALDTLFTPAYSTFEPTKRDKNVDNVNTIPGTDSNYFDCRILPTYNIDDVLKVFEEKISKFKKKYQIEIETEILQKSVAPQPTDKNSEIVQSLLRVLKEERNIDGKLVGIGGGTCAAFFRANGNQSVVWSTLDDVEHSPNEYCRLENLEKDILVFTKLMI
ncbi:MAG: M20 family metallo-hydrolase [Thermoplasmata archaeon]